MKIKVGYKIKHHRASFITDQELSRGSAATMGPTSPHVSSVWAPRSTLQLWSRGLFPSLLGRRNCSPYLCKGTAGTQARSSTMGRHLPH